MKKQHKVIVQAIIVLGFCLLLLLSLVSHDSRDLAFSGSPPHERPANWAGIIGAYISWVLLQALGGAAYLIPLILIVHQINRLRGIFFTHSLVKWTGTIILFWTFSAFLSMTSHSAPDSIQWARGGALGYFSSLVLIDYLGITGAGVTVGVLLVLSLLLATEFQIVSLCRQSGKFTRKLTAFLARLLLLVGRGLWKARQGLVEVTRKEGGPVRKVRVKPVKPERPVLRPEKEEKKEPLPVKEKIPRKVEVKPEGKVEEPVAVSGPGEGTEGYPYRLPGLDLLEIPPPVTEREIKDDLNKSGRILEETLSDFGIEAKIVHIERGPVITRYELEPAPGVRVQKITALNANIALAMKAQAVRIVAPIPGKSRIGIEVPNTTTALVYLREILNSREFRNSVSRITLALGKTIAGEPLMADLADMPHLLIAGATGSGKTACVNSLLTSILFQASPEEVKFLLIDPKMVELSPFNGLPHLLSPVVTDTKKVSAALNWVVAEMGSRFELFAREGARNIDGYNEKVSSASEQLPFIVVVIDELADLMAVASQEIEIAITRLAQLSRAVGIHIILATQRPSVDVITGVIKANFPARISFQVASKVDSRTVLDANGAEKLLGKGDLLFMEPGSSKLIRAQGTLTHDAEIERVVKFIKAQRQPVYQEEMLKIQEKGGGYKSFEEDEYYEEAKKLVVETGQASVSMLQRRLGLGYQRAARLIDTMEEKGIVGPYRGSRPREVLVKPEDVEEKTGAEPRD